MKKFLSLHDTYFKLPDDFEGSLGDAVILLGEYINKDTPLLPSRNGPTRWDDFISVVSRGGRFVTSFRLREATWVKIDPRIKVNPK